MYFNLWLVFLASGLWHGASWNFIIWGGYHGFFLVAERSAIGRLIDRMGKYFRTILTFFIVVIGWVFFRIEHFHDAALYIKTMFGFSSGNFHAILASKFYFFLVIAFVFSFLTLSNSGMKLQNYFYGSSHSSRGYFALGIISIVLFAICLSSITSQNFNPFIYFRFWWTSGKKYLADWCCWSHFLWFSG